MRKGSPSPLHARTPLSTGVSTVGEQAFSKPRLPGWKCRVRLPGVFWEPSDKGRRLLPSLFRGVFPMGFSVSPGGDRHGREATGRLPAPRSLCRCISPAHGSVIIVSLGLF